MKSLFSLLLVLLPTIAMSAEPFIVNGAEPGSYLLTVAADGAVTVVPIKVVTVNGVPSPQPPTNPTTEFSRRIAEFTDQALKNGGTATTASVISSVYSLVADSVDKGSIDHTRSLEAIRFALGPAIANQSDKDKWVKFNTDLENALDELRVTGKLVTKEQYVGVLREVATGMNSVTGFPGPTSISPNAIFENIDIAKLIEIIELIVKLLTLFKG